MPCRAASEGVDQLVEDKGREDHRLRLRERRAGQIVEKDTEATTDNYCSHKCERFEHASGEDAFVRVSRWPVHDVGIWGFYAQPHRR